MKPKRYIIEMCNDFARAFEKDGDREALRKIERYRNAYISGLITELETLEMAIQIYRTSKERGITE